MIASRHIKRMAGGKASQIRTLAFLAEDPVRFSSTYNHPNFSFRVSSSLFWPHLTHSAYTYV